MAATPAARRYLKRFAPTMIAYFIALFGANWAMETWHPTGATLVALAILPALPIVGVIAVIGLYILEENDEYQRAQAVQGMLIGLGFMLALASVWGFLEEAGAVPHVKAYWAFVTWCAGWGIAQCVLKLRERGAGGAA
ncbi:hypothetical protein OF829_02260 [Sphingomonas sp. LB-2]|uniref:hypothetical protein n=1 Tax=Sphingomonas caeni TaxID=2984949 RepID=UPI0022320158|nr:hypothetical protein [Sphingomonas caeni]MCW3846044.1 hypothetical protein [Sphingomonas caeni]